MPYKITAETKRRAKAAGLQVKPSKTKGKKLDVYREGKKLFSIGAIGYPDFVTLKAAGKKEEALKRQKRFKARFKSLLNDKQSPIYYSNLLLW